MVITVVAIVNYATLTQYEMTYEHPIDLITPQFVRRMVKEGGLEGKAFIIFAGERVCYAVKHNHQFHVKYLN